MIPVTKSLNENIPTFFAHSLNFDFGLPNKNKLPFGIMDLPIKQNTMIDEPTNIIPNLKDLPTPTKHIQLPTNEIVEKQAVRMIIIRRQKMRKHKLRKFRKRVQFLRAKIKIRRELKREKKFHASLLAQIKQAQNFDAKKYVAKRIEKYITPVPLRMWKGEVLSKAMIEAFQKEKEENKLRKKLKREFRLTL